jgi:multidrug efflux system membrane fusion protein
MKKLSSITLSILVLAVVGLTSCGKHEEAQSALPTEEVFSVQTGKTEITPMTATFKATGTLEGIREATINSETNGRIVAVGIENGSRVGQGSALVQVDNELKIIALRQAEAARETAEAALAKAKLDLNRSETLTRDNAITKSQLEIADLGVKTAQAQLKAAESGEAYAKRQLADATVRAPFGGTVAMRFVNQGELLNPGVRVASIVDDSKMKLKIGVSELDIPLIKNGDKVVVSVDAIHDKTFEGKIITIGSKADMARAYMVEVEIPNPGNKLKSGMFARAEIKRDAARDVATVPTSAIITNGTKTQVYVVNNNVAKLTAVKTGISNTERVEITEGLTGDEVVVTFGQNQIKNGSKVRITN